MKEYFLVSIANHLLPNAKSEAFIKAVSKFQDFLFTEDGVSEFIQYLDGKCTKLNNYYPHIKPYGLSYHNGVDESFWVSVQAGAYNECTFMFKKVAGQWQLPKEEEGQR